MVIMLSFKLQERDTGYLNARVSIVDMNIDHSSTSGPALSPNGQ